MVVRSLRMPAPCCWVQTDPAIRLTEHFAARFADTRTPGLVEHQVETLVMQRVVGIALGYEDLNDHDDLLPLGPEPEQSNRKKRIGRRLRTHRTNHGISVLRYRERLS